MNALTTTRWKLTPRTISRPWTIALIISIVSGLLMGFIGLRWLEREVTFHPVRFSPNADWVKPVGASDVWLRTSDHENLDGWFFSSNTRPSRATIIYFHGNGGNITNVGWVGERLSARGFDVLLFDYRGYGKSSGYSDSERDLYRDADASYDYLVNTLKVGPQKIILFGQSLGTAAVVDVASRRICGGIVLESGISSASDVARSLLPPPLQWVHFFTKNKFDSVSKLPRVHCPVLITHGDPDPVIPTEQGRMLYAAANEPKQFLTFPGAGHNVFGFGGDAYLDIISDFISARTKASLETTNRVYNRQR